MSWVTPADVRARWPGAPADDAVLQAWIDDAEVIVRAEYPWIDEWIAADDTLPGVLAVVVTRMVIRALSSPMGVTREQVGDTNVQYAGNGGLYLTEDDRALLDGVGPQAAFTIDQMPADQGYDVAPSLVGAWVNRDGFAPWEFDPFDMPPPARPDRAAPYYSPRRERQ